ncbi:hypothetical protein BpJC7_27620 [Weizmannia acidilactici]|uniref:Type II secretion system protein n=1 Tax=Weizmannia acidilactici TaxID=2607726 RepID=A0A5J4JJP7_9BACI|nr:prepilin-type N-terminal cleavage/methylation domain-containing protein [Weizmannia acidilactici]GER68364.1 hypothetical protein BpJC4_28350 [Weizmannia acidilactici]GER71459.1 hypothetical protein BpJC7_27620 [Weizmannia acidilactici]GER72779.1 hypothetical protein BpPP18_08460 [Weizmannia acidilactici]
MWKNEKGFTLAETVAAFAVFCMMAAALFPPLVNMFGQIKESKQQMAAARFLYEKTEEWVFTGNVPEREKTLEGAKMAFHIEDQGRKACVDYEEKKICVTVQQ